MVDEVECEVSTDDDCDSKIRNTHSKSDQLR